MVSPESNVQSIKAQFLDRCFLLPLQILFTDMCCGVGVDFPGDLNDTQVYGQYQTTQIECYQAPYKNVGYLHMWQWAGGHPIFSCQTQIRDIIFSHPQENMTCNSMIQFVECFLSHFWTFPLHLKGLGGTPIFLLKCIRSKTRKHVECPDQKSHFLLLNDAEKADGHISLIVITCVALLPGSPECTLHSP